MAPRGMAHRAGIDHGRSRLHSVRSARLPRKSKLEGPTAKVAKVAKVDGGPATTFATFATFADGHAEIRNPEPPAEIWTDAHDERAAIVEHDGAAPRAWAEGFARLDLSKPPADVPPKRWLRFIDDYGRFLDGGWAARAAALGWGP